MKRKVLIIKLGWSETLDAEIGHTTSLGDVLRSTVILHAFKNDSVTWLVDQSADLLLNPNPYIERLVHYSEENLSALEKNQFDIVVNLEKVPQICVWADSLTCTKRYGFYYSSQAEQAAPHPGSEWVFKLCNDAEMKKNHQRTWQEALLEMVDCQWQGQEYVLGYQPRSTVQFDFGLNHAVGPKWPTKAWPMNHWEALAKKMQDNHLTVSWQKGLANLHVYMDWIHSCRVIITNDSLGLHLALALKKPVIALLGPTNLNENYLYERGIKFYPSGFPCAPCFQPKCTNNEFCLNAISVDDVFSGAIGEWNQLVCASKNREVCSAPLL